MDPIFTIHQALLAGREKALPIWGLHHFMLEILAVVFPAVASMVWPSLSFTLVLSMAFTSENTLYSPLRKWAEGGVSGQGLGGGGCLSRVFSPQHLPNRAHTPACSSIGV